jgi:hypothetical protein
MNRTNKKVWMIAGTILLSMLIFNVNLAAQPKAEKKADEVSKIKEENKILLELFKNFRVADVRDGMDWIGYHNFGSIDPGVRPLYRTKAVGIARTARYLPFEGPYPDEKGDDYTKWQGMIKTHAKHYMKN